MSKEEQALNLFKMIKMQERKTKNEKVYIILCEESNTDDDEFYSIISYVTDTLEKAKVLIKNIKEDMIYEYAYDIDIRKMIKDTNNGFIVEWGNGYTKYEICERELI